MINSLPKKFRNFAVMECKGSSPLYEYLSLQIAEDHEMLELAVHAKEGQPNQHVKRYSCIKDRHNSFA